MSDPFGDRAQRERRLAALERMLEDPKLDHAGRQDIRHQMLAAVEHRVEAGAALRMQADRHRRLDEHLRRAIIDISERARQRGMAVPVIVNAREVVAASAAMIKRLPKLVEQLQTRSGSLGESMAMVEQLSKEVGEADAHIRSMLNGLGSNFGPEGSEGDAATGNTEAKEQT